MLLGIVGAATGVLGLVVSIITFVNSRRLQARQAQAAITGDLYPVLRELRDHAWQYVKPLGGQKNDDLVAIHYGLIDLADLHPAIEDKILAVAVEQLLAHDASGLAMSIDPPRFMGAVFAEATILSFDDFATQAGQAVLRCQALRKGVA